MMVTSCKPVSSSVLQQLSNTAAIASSLSRASRMLVAGYHQLGSRQGEGRRRRRSRRRVSDSSLGESECDTASNGSGNETRGDSEQGSEGDEHGRLEERQNDKRTRHLRSTQAAVTSAAQQVLEFVTPIIELHCHGNHSAEVNCPRL